MAALNAILGQISALSATVTPIVSHYWHLACLATRIYVAYFCFLMLVMSPFWLPMKGKHKAASTLATVACVLVALYVFCNSSLSKYLVA